MSLMDKITPAEKEFIRNYTSKYAFRGNGPIRASRQESVEVLLKTWREEKEWLYEVMGEQLLLSRSVTIAKDLDAVTRDMEQEMNRDAMGNFISEWMRTMVADNRNIFRNWNSTTSYYEPLWTMLTTPRWLVNNTYEGESCDIPLPEDKIFKLEKGCKLMKAIGKIAAAYNIKGFEEFRLRHSMILNDKSIRGKLCLSIHPLDYMTMSDNDYNWSSCMSWRNGGCYRRGTVACMNSPYVVVVYLCNEDGKDGIEDQAWNSKKWRTLMLVDPTFAVTVKAYPYSCRALSVQAINWMRELLLTNKNISLPEPRNFRHDKEYGVSMEHGLEEHLNILFQSNGAMYNDFGSPKRHYGAFDMERIGTIPSDEYPHIEIDYSGVSTCMCCGRSDVYFTSRDSLVCEDCFNVPRCTCCNSYLTETEENDPTLLIDEHHVCAHCYESFNGLATDDLDGSIHLEHNMTRYYVIPYDMVRETSSGSRVLAGSEHLHDFPSFMTNIYEGSPIWLTYFTETSQTINEHNSWRRESFIAAEAVTNEGWIQVNALLSLYSSVEEFIMYWDKRLAEILEAEKLKKEAQERELAEAKERFRTAITSLRESNGVGGADGDNTLGESLKRVLSTLNLDYEPTRVYYFHDDCSEGTLINLA